MLKYKDMNINFKTALECKLRQYIVNNHQSKAELCSYMKGYLHALIDCGEIASKDEYQHEKIITAITLDTREDDSGFCAWLQTQLVHRTAYNLRPYEIDKFFIKEENRNLFNMIN